jgi:hypothetical protein
MDQALIGLAGIVVGALLGGTGKYFTQRRDAWRQARASGLLLLADVKALLLATDCDPVIARTELGVASWNAQREVLAAFRKGKYPSGFVANEWLSLADCFARLESLYATRPAQHDVEWWGKVRAQLSTAAVLLARFSKDPPVVRSVIKAALPDRFRRTRVRR